MSNEDAILATARAQMMYDANKKSAGVAYLLLLFVGVFGAHRFYLQRTGSAVGQLIMGIIGPFTLFLLWIPLGIWLFVDLFLVSGIVQERNMALADKFAVR